MYIIELVMAAKAEVANAQGDGLPSAHVRVSPCLVESIHEHTQSWCTHKWVHRVQ